MLTGSHAYGWPHNESDIDLVVFMDPDDIRTIHTANDGTDPEDVYEGMASFPLRFGKLNLILCADPKAFEVWQKGTATLCARARSKPVTRDEACAHFKKLRQEVRDAQA